MDLEPLLGAIEDAQIEEKVEEEEAKTLQTPRKLRNPKSHKVDVIVTKPTDGNI